MTTITAANTAFKATSGTIDSEWASQDFTVPTADATASKMTVQLASASVTQSAVTSYALFVTAQSWWTVAGVQKAQTWFSPKVSSAGTYLNIVADSADVKTSTTADNIWTAQSQAAITGLNNFAGADGENKYSATYST